MDNFELICYNYFPSERINWGSTNETNERKTLYFAKLYNSNKRKKIYFLSLFMLANEKSEKFTLLVRGNLNNWYSQKILGRELTLEEYKDCINLLLLQIDVDRNELINAKVKNSEIRIGVLLNSTNRGIKDENKFTSNL